jgi:hypothetical protein
MNLEPLFRQLQPPQAEGVSFTAEVIPSWPAFRVGVDVEGRPAVLVATADEWQARFRLGSELKHVSLTPAAECSLASSDGETTAMLAVIRCKSDVPEFQRLFLNVLASWIEILGQQPSADALMRGFQNLVQLFEALLQPPTSDLKGLWGELLVIAASPDPALLVRAWHCVPTELYDFTTGLQLAEVKTTSVRPRRHDVSLAQVTPPEGSALVLVSVVVEESEPRTSLRDLANRAKQRLGDAALRLRIEEVIAATLGSDWAQAHHVAYCVRRALQSLRVYAAEGIPTVNRDLPPEISDVRFRVELDGIPELAYKELRERGGLHAALAASDQLP